MTPVVFAMLLAVAPPTQPPIDASEARGMVGRSLPFMAKEAVGWLETRKCATCHHAPMMLWTHYEAGKYGFPVDEKAVREVERKALAQYLSHPEFMPTGQDAGFLERRLGPGTIYLTLAVGANPSPDAEAVEAMRRLRANFVKHQNENGSWTTKINQAPLVDGHDVTTMLILLAMGKGGSKAVNGKARDKASKWLTAAPPRDEIQPLVLRILVAHESGEKEEVRRLRGVLRGKQQANGGWRQKDGRPADALATGQALYALGVTGGQGDDQDVRRAWAFLAATQRKDGSWLVLSQNPNSRPPVITYVGTGWATLGLIRTLPKVPNKPR